MKKRYLQLATLAALLVCSAVTTNANGAQQAPVDEQVSGAVQVLQDSSFAEFKSKGLVVIDFYSDTCPPCRRLAPEFEKVANNLASRAQFGKLNILSSPQSAKEAKVRAIPCVVVYANGKEVDRNVGYLTEQELTKFVLKNTK